MVLENVVHLFPLHSLIVKGWPNGERAIRNNHGNERIKPSMESKAQSSRCIMLVAIQDMFGRSV